MHRSNIRIPTPVIGTLFALSISISGCSSTSPIQPVNSSNSKFDGAVFSGDSVVINSSTPGNEAFRVFHQGATGFVSVASVRASAEHRATEFCGRNRKVLRPLRETASTPPHILGNFPRIEIIFEYIDSASKQAAELGGDSKYVNLLNLKKLLDTGVLSQQEFEAEKAKVLSQP